MKHMKRNVQKGFTLIELMIVIAIVAILVALAVPAYQDYTVRAKVTECINGAAPLKLTVSEFRMDAGTWPTANQAGIVGGSGNSTFCNDWGYVGTGIITITAPGAGLGIATDVVATLTPQPPNAGGIITWLCSSTSVATNKYLPSSCRAT